MSSTAARRKQAIFKRAKPNASRFYQIVDGKIILSPEFKRRNLHPEWAAHLRRIRSLGIGLPEIVTIRGKFVEGRSANILGTLSD